MKTEAEKREQMAQLKAWFHSWSPAFSFISAVMAALVMPSLLYFLSNHFVTQADHARDIAIIQRDVDRLGEALHDNKGDHEKITQLLLKLTESVARLEGESKTKPAGSRQTGGVLNW